MDHPVLYLVRHGALLGQAPDAPLTAAGRAGARALADLLQDVGCRRISVLRPHQPTCSAARKTESAARFPAGASPPRTCSPASCAGAAPRPWASGVGIDGFRRGRAARRDQESNRRQQSAGDRRVRMVCQFSLPVPTLRLGDKITDSAGRW